MKKPVRKCGECIHYYACSSWNVGTLLQTDASHCVNYEKSSKQGNWNKAHSDYWTYVCSECGRVEDTRHNYCPNCGADMRGEEDDS